MLTHFWKLFAVATLALSAWLAYELRESMEAARFWMARPGTSRHSLENEVVTSVLRGSGQKQMKPGFVRLIDGYSIYGYLHSVTDFYVHLFSIHEDGTVNRSAIPIERVLCIQTTVALEKEAGKK